MQCALQFQHRDATALEHDDVGPARIARQFILEDRRIFVCRRIAHPELATLPLQPGNRLVPRSNLLGCRFRDELLQLEASDSRLGA